MLFPLRETVRQSLPIPVVRALEERFGELDMIEAAMHAVERRERNDYSGPPETQKRRWTVDGKQIAQYRRLA